LVLISCSILQLSPLVRGWRLTGCHYRMHSFREMSSSSFGRVRWKLGNWSPAYRGVLSSPSCCRRIEFVAVSVFPISVRIACSSGLCFCRKFHSAKKSNTSIKQTFFVVNSFCYSGNFKDFSRYFLVSNFSSKVNYHSAQY